MEDVMSVTPLGSGQEVGRSCHVLEFRGLKIMLDIGIHPGCTLVIRAFLLHGIVDYLVSLRWWGRSRSSGCDGLYHAGSLSLTYFAFSFTHSIHQTTA